MNKDVLISISGLHHEVDQEEAVEVVAKGIYYKKNGKSYVLYDEISQDSGKITKNTIKIGNDQVDIIKRGENNVHMVFQQGKQKVSFYNTPVGELLVQVDTSSIKVLEENEDKIVAKIVYNLNVNQSHISKCSIEIKICSQ